MKRRTGLRLGALALTAVLALGAWLVFGGGRDPDAGKVLFGVGQGCQATETAVRFQMGDQVHGVGVLSVEVPAGGRLEHEVLHDGLTTDAGLDEPATQAYDCVFGDFDTGGLQPGLYTVRYAFDGETVAIGSFTLLP
jgi:hypothetical protein